MACRSIPPGCSTGRATPVDPSALAKRAGWRIDGQLVRGADGAVVPGGLLPATETAPPPGAAVAGGIPSGADERDLAVLTYLQSMRELVEAQREVFVAYLGGTSERSALPALAGVATSSPPAPAVAAGAPATVVGSGGGPEDGRGAGRDPGTSLDADRVMEMLLALVGERTGYPLDMLGPDLDLEADLSIDSIKRLEIIGELADRAGLGAGVGATGSLDESIVEELVTQKTLRSIVEWIGAHLLTSDPTPSTAPVGAQPAAAAPAGMPHGDDLMQLLLTLVGERTGYPMDMLGPDLDLEADLSIDSIKRLEILGELADRAGVGSAAGGALDESIVEELVAQKSLRAIVAWVDAHLGGEGDGPSGAGSAGAGPPASTTPPPTTPSEGDLEPVAAGDVPERSVRAVFRAVACPGRTDPALSLYGADLVVLDDRSGLAQPLADRLTAAGAEVRVCHHRTGTEIPVGDRPPDGMIQLAVAPGGAQLPESFELIRLMGLNRPGWLISVTGLGGSHGRGSGPVATGGADGLPEGAGLAGLWRSLARELPDTLVRSVDLDLDEGIEAAVGNVIAELTIPDGPVVVGYRSGERITVEAHEEEAPSGGTVSVSPGLDRESVVLLTGGARGITARLAVSLARSTGCSLELVGRSPLPDAPEDDDLRDAADEPSLRRALIGRGMRVPAEIEAACSRVLADREIRQTLSALEDAGVKVSYHAADVTDADAVAEVVRDIYARHGRLDGVVHGAGVIEDRLLADKTPDSFRRVFDTKVAGATALLGALRDDQPFVVLFTSVSGAFGNRGQVDYSAANDALSTWAWSLARRRGPGAGRVVAVDWGPWADTGMVSPELEREYAKRGVGLLDTEDAIGRLLAELARPDGEPEIVVARAAVERFAAPGGDPVGHGRT